ncbi:hypothetical protein PC129_g19635 [Phytophthora cactorum]|uniref:Integrase catalytic domain-containing protein n=1 Tax=Phytophthora cactorum TaxID=29920 RepID=A0A8T1HAT5_9STRA|nr:hypothetical protein PC129_g19635 [Phytophthora cactorum]KAG4042156.1 hypothetical protein PC123_g22347 [Phytophthora cactorum]
MDMAGDAVTRPVRRCATTDADEERKDASVPVELTVRDGGDVRVPRVEGMPEAGYDEGELVACEQRETPISRKTLEPRTSAVDTRKKKAAMSSRDETGRREDEQRVGPIRGGDKEQTAVPKPTTTTSSARLVDAGEHRGMKFSRRTMTQYGLGILEQHTQRGSRKTRPSEVVPPLRSIKTGDVGDRLALDATGPLTTPKEGRRYVIAAVGYVTRYAVTTTVKQRTAENVAKFLIQQVVLKFGPFRERLTDGAPELTDLVIEQLVMLLQTQIINPVPYDEEITEQSSDVLVELRRGRRRSQARRYVLEYGIRPTRAADGRNEPKTLKMLSESAEDSCAEPYGSDLWHASEVSGRVEHVGAADENRTAEIQYPDVML